MTATHDQLSHDLVGAVHRGEIVAYFQPQITAAGGHVVAAEALSRWVHPTEGMIPPDVFIPIAEETGLIDELGDFMLRAACEFAVTCQAQGHAIDIAVNVSADQLHDPDYSANVVKLLREVGLHPKYLTIEITESLAIIDISEVAQRLDWLRAVGVSISVDDFGTGFSSVGQVLDLRATELKIDKAFVQYSPATVTSLLTAVVDFAHDRGLRVVAEGVETEEQLARVRALPCDRVQGYLIGMPVPASEFDLHLTH